MSIYIGVVCLVTKSCLTLLQSCGLKPGFSVHGIPQARILEWGVILFTRGSSQPRDQTYISCIDSQMFYHSATRESLSLSIYIYELYTVETSLLLHTNNKKKYPQNQKSPYLVLYPFGDLSVHLTVPYFSATSIFRSTVNFGLFSISGKPHKFLSRCFYISVLRHLFLRKVNIYWLPIVCLVLWT